MATVIKETSEGHNNGKRNVEAKSTDHLIAGGLAGLISAVSLQPFDLLKTRLQQQKSPMKNDNQRTITQEIRKLKQYKELWRGALPSALRTSLGAGIYFTSLSACRNYLAALKLKGGHVTESVSATSALPKLSPVENLCTGFAMRALAGMVTMPITIIKTRFESNAYKYNSIAGGVNDIYQGSNNQSPSVRHFFKGSMATLARDCPYAGLYVLFYETFKNDLLPSLLPLSTEFVAGAALVNSLAAVLSASVSTTLTAPFDAIKTRLQLSALLMNFMQASASLMKEKGGVRNYFNGLSLRLARKGIASGISWCIYEELIRSNYLRQILAGPTKL